MDDRDAGQNNTQQSTQNPTPSQSVVGSVNKELEPSKVEQPGIGEHLVSSEPELELPEDVEKAGAQITPQRPQIKHIDRGVGVRHAGESIPISDVPIIKLPVIDEERLAELEKRAADDSGRSFATLYRKMIKKIMLGLAKLGG